MYRRGRFCGMSCGGTSNGYKHKVIHSKYNDSSTTGMSYWSEMN